MILFSAALLDQMIVKATQLTLSAFESFFSNLKSEQIKKRIYNTREEARSEVFDYIEGFYNRVRRHKHLDQLSPHEFERKRQSAL